MKVRGSEGPKVRRAGALLLAGVLSLASACASAPPAVGSASAPRAGAPESRGGGESLSILHFNDVYEIDGIENGEVGGLARVGTLIERARRQAAPLLTTLGGDFLSPSALGTARVDGERLAGRQMVDILNRIGLDWATLGNHEFDLTEAAFRARMTEAKYGTVISNATYADGRPFENTVPRAIVPVRTATGRMIRLGLVGLVLDMNRQPWVRYTPVLDAAREQIAAMQGQTDAIVALTHVSLAADEDLAQAVPEIDVILGGHEHENWLLYRGSRLTPIVKADANAKTVAMIRLDFGPVGSRPVVTARIQPVNTAVPEQPDVRAAVAGWVERAFAAFRAEGMAPEQLVVTSTDSLDGRATTVRNATGNLTDLITASLRREVKDAEVAVMNGGSIRIDDVLPAGPIRQYDIIRVLPFGGKVVRATFEGSLLTRVLTIGENNRGSGGFLHVSGASKNGNTWTVGGAPIDPARKYVVATTDFLLTGLETGLDFLTRKNPQVSDVTDLGDIRNVLMNEIRARYPR